MKKDKIELDWEKTAEVYQCKYECLKYKVVNSLLILFGLLGCLAILNVLLFFVMGDKI